MGLFNWSEKIIQKMDVWDIGALKLYCFVLGVIVGAIFPVFILSYLWIFIVVVVLMVIKLLITIFVRKPKE